MMTCSSVIQVGIDKFTNIQFSKRRWNEFWMKHSKKNEQHWLQKDDPKHQTAIWSVKRGEAAAAKAGNCRIFFKETDTCVRKDWLLVFFGAKCYTFFIARFFGHFSFFFCLRKIVSLLFRVCNCLVILLKIGRLAILMCRLYNNTKISVSNLFWK